MKRDCMNGQNFLINLNLKITYENCPKSSDTFKIIRASNIGISPIKLRISLHKCY